MELIATMEALCHFSLARTSHKSSRRARMILRAFDHLDESQRVAPMYLLLRAEESRLSDRKCDVNRAYDAAILAASRHCFLNLEVIANERAAGHCKDQGEREQCRNYLDEAIRVAKGWAPLEVRWIQERYSLELLNGRY